MAKKDPGNEKNKLGKDPGVYGKKRGKPRQAGARSTMKRRPVWYHIYCYDQLGPVLHKRQSTYPGHAID